MAAGDPLQPLLPGDPLRPDDATLGALAKGIGHAFARPELAAEALTHRSALDRQPALKATFPNGNERLEFLGDRVLALVMAEALLDRDGGADAGQLSKRLHVLVSREICAEVARDLGVGPALRLPGGESRRGAREQTRFLADACEALIGALYLDAGLARASALVLAAWTPVIEAPHDERLLRGLGAHAQGDVGLALRDFTLEAQLARIGNVLRASQANVGEVAVGVTGERSRTSDINLLKLQHRVGKRSDLRGHAFRRQRPEPRGLDLRVVTFCFA